MATSDYASPAQAKLMRARAHGWKPKNPRGGLPSAAVASEFVEAKDRKYAGGFAENRYAGGGRVRMGMGGMFQEALRQLPEGHELRIHFGIDQPGAPTLEATGTTGGLPGPTRDIPGAGTTTPLPTRAAPAPRAPVPNPHALRARAHKSRIEDILRGGAAGAQVGRVKSPGQEQPIKMQMGGLAAMMAAKNRGAPTMGGRPKGGIPPTQPRGGGAPGRGGLFGGLAQAMMQRQGLGRRGGRPPMPGQRGGQQPPVGPPGGPRTPPNMQGMFQRMQMQNRPRGGPAGGGGNRVGQSDQQGALARALQRGTGRPPMSRRNAFPGSR